MPEPKRFRKKAIEVEAVQWTGENREEVEAFVGDSTQLTFGATTLLLWSGTVYPGGFVIRNPKAPDKVFVRSASEFEATYEPAPASLHKDGGEGQPCVSCNGSGHEWEPGPTGEAISKGPCCECGGLGVEYKRGQLAEDIIERLEPLETEAKETLDRLKAKRLSEGVLPSAPASPAELVAYAGKRIWRDAICTVADADYQRFVLAASTQPASPSPVEEGDWPDELTVYKRKGFAGKPTLDRPGTGAAELLFRLAQSQSEGTK